MTSRERLLAALNHVTADRPALDIGGSYATGINTAAYRNLKTHLHLDTPTELASKPLMEQFSNYQMAATRTSGASCVAGRKEDTIT